MHAAIKSIEDTLLIRRLQERQLCHEKDSSERIMAIQKDIASLERGLKLLISAPVSPSAQGPQSTVNGSAPGSPTFADPGQNEREAS